jgi:lysozyme family protein
MTFLTDVYFCAIIPIILELEGGYVNNPSDPGGATNFGISQRSYPSVNIAQLTEDDAANIYYTDYWLAGKCNAMPFPLCAYYFDACVNQGPSEAALILQKTVGVAQDGVVGPATLAACNGTPGTQHYIYLTNRLAHYRTLTTWSTFGDGWTNRLLRLAASLP